MYRRAYVKFGLGWVNVKVGTNQSISPQPSRSDSFTTFAGLMTSWEGGSVVFPDPEVLAGDGRGQTRARRDGSSFIWGTTQTCHGDGCWHKGLELSGDPRGGRRQEERPSTEPWT